MAIARSTAAASPPAPTSARRSDALRQLEALLPRIVARARRCEADRRVPDETIADLHSAGLFGATRPLVFGGSDLGFESLVDITMQLSAACGSTGWVYGVLAGHSWLLNLFPPEAQREIYRDPEALMATVFRLGGTITRESGGYRLKGGEGRFCSGIDHAGWVIVGNQVIDEKGGAPEPRFFVIPRSDISEIVDDWYVSGLRGTGSKTIRIHDAFIPEHRSVAVAQMAAGTTPGAAFHGAPLFKVSYRDIAPFSIAGVPVGIALGAVGGFSSTMSAQLASFGEQQLAEQSSTFARVAEAAAEIEAAQALLLRAARRLDELRDPAELTPLERARIPRDWAWTAQTSRYAVTRLFEAAGGSGLYDSSELQRSWRDVNAAAQHYAFTWDGAMTAYGRATLGVQPGRYGAKGREG